MSSEQLCMGCMRPLEDGQKTCSLCGYPVDGANPPKYLPVRTVLCDRYLVGRVLQFGGGTALYAAYDMELNTPIHLHELLPDALCTRSEDGSLIPLNGCEAAYQSYVDKFLTRARSIAKMRDLPCVIPLYDMFETNGTAYAVSEQCAGIRLDLRLAQIGDRARWEDVRPLFMSLMGTLNTLHSAGLYHLGISPANLLMGTDGKLHLLGFFMPETRVVGGDIKPQFYPGFSAPEQYVLGRECGAAADVYAVAATLFRVLTGETLPDAAERASAPSKAELMMPADVAKALPDTIKKALVKALQVQPERRLQTIAEFRDMLSAAPAVNALKDEPIEDEPPTAKSMKPKKNRKFFIVILLCAILLFSLLAGGILLLVFPDIFTGDDTSSTPSTTVSHFSSDVSSSVSSSPVSADGVTTYAVDNVLGKLYNEVKDSVTLNGNMRVEAVSLVFNDAPRGTILEQTPAPEAIAEKGSVIQVVISAGPEETTVADLTGWPQEYAKAYLEALGFAVDIRFVAISDYEYGLVQETSPAAGELVKEGDTIILVVSGVGGPPSTSPENGETTTPSTSTTVPIVQ